MRFVILVSFSFGFFGSVFAQYVNYGNPNCFSDLTELIARDGFSGEEHQITTPDGYILTAHRVLDPSSGPADGNKEIVILLHGLFFSSADWLLLGSDNALPYRLAREGYDVWMLNFRGNDYSQKHTYMDADRDSEYWNFSWHEMGIYDLPATIDYTLAQSRRNNVAVNSARQNVTGLNNTGVNNPGFNNTGLNNTGFNNTGLNNTGFNNTGLNNTGFNNTGLNNTSLNNTSQNNTGQNNVTFVCYSQGCTAVFVASNYYPNITDQVKFVSAMAPGVYMGNTAYPNVKMMALTEIPMRMRPGGMRNRRFQPTGMRGMANAVCSNLPPEMCQRFAVYGFDLANANRSIISALPCYTPSGVSQKQIMHYFQLINCNCFREYDFGPMNLMKYGSYWAPSYDLSRVKYPVSIYSGTYDKMVVPVDAQRTGRELGNLVAVHSVPVGHYDFLYGNNVRQFVYDPLIEELKNFKEVPRAAAAPTWSWW